MLTTPLASRLSHGRVTGSDSPLSADSSRLALGLSSRPSTGTTSPRRTSST